MIPFLKKEEINTFRLYNLDLIKAISIVLMIFCHCVLILGVNHTGYGSYLIYYFCTVVMTDFFISAHALVFAMGVGIVFTKNNSSADYIKRGITLFLLGYIMTFFSFHIYTITKAVLIGKFNPSMLVSLFDPDVFEFAGLALILTGIFKKLKLNEIHIFIISIVMSIAGSYFVLIDTCNTVGNILLGHFITTNLDKSCFPLLNWYIFVAFGMVFGMIFRRVENIDLFYKRLLVISGVASLVYIALTVRFGILFLTKEGLYFSVCTVDAFGLLSIDLCALSAFYFIIKKIGVSMFSISIEISKNMTVIYFFHWCIIGFMYNVFGYFLGYKFPYYIVCLLGIASIYSSFYFGRLWNKLKTKKALKSNQS